MDVYTFISDANSPEPQDHLLPESAKGGDVDSAGRIPHVICQIDLGRFLKILPGGIFQAESRRDQTVDTRGQGAAVPRSPVVIFEAVSDNFFPESVFKEIKGHNHIALLHYLGGLCPLVTQKNIEWRCSRLIVSNVNVFELEIALKLLNHAVLPRHVSIDVGRDIPPLFRLRVIQSD